MGKKPVKIQEESRRYVPEDKTEKACVATTNAGTPCRGKGPFYHDRDKVVRCRAHSTCPEARAFRENFKLAGKLAGEAQRGIPWAMRAKKTNRQNPNDPAPTQENILSLARAAQAGPKSYWPANPNMETPAGIRLCIKSVAQNCASGIWDDRKCRAMNDTLKTALNALDNRNEHVETNTERLLLELVQKA